MKKIIALAAAATFGIASAMSMAADSTKAPDTNTDGSTQHAKTNDTPRDSQSSPQAPTTDATKKKASNHSEGKNQGGTRTDRGTGGDATGGTTAPGGTGGSGG